MPEIFSQCPRGLLEAAPPRQLYGANLRPKYEIFRCAASLKFEQGEAVALVRQQFRGALEILVQVADFLSVVDSAAAGEV